MIFMLLPLLIFLPLIILAGGKAELKEVLEYALTVGVLCLPLIKFFR